MSYRKKLIEVALPLEAINRESIHEKSVPRRGHPATLHLWWARRPLATCRAVLFGQLVDDPSSRPEECPTEEAQDRERLRLFRIIEQLVKWENSNNEQVLDAARAEIRKSTGGTPPPVLDPFCGGGSIPLEAQRLGLEAHASDLNPVAVLVTKALIEMASKFAGQPPINPEARKKLAYSSGWLGAQGLADDLRYYGKWVRDEAEHRIGHLYPKVRLPRTHGGGMTTVIACLWARTVKCPNPACAAQMPLVRSFWLSSKKGNSAWVQPVVDRRAKKVSFEVNTGSGAAPDGTVNRRGARCIVCETSVTLQHVRAEGEARRMSQQLMAVVAEGKRSRVYLEPVNELERAARDATPTWRPDCELPKKHRNFQTPAYGMPNVGDLFTPRQLVALNTFSDLVHEAREQVHADAATAGLPDNGVSLHAGGTGATAYADAIATYLSFAIDKLADWSSTVCSWIHSIQGVRDTFARQAIPMVWDFVEINPLSTSVGNYWNHVEWVASSLAGLSSQSSCGTALQLDATAALNEVTHPVIYTDPPYYDNIAYADLSDFFYVWLRRSIGSLWPQLFSTVLAPKAQELVVAPHRFGGDKEVAKRHFEDGLLKAFRLIRQRAHPEYPFAVYYAFKQVEEEEDDENGGDEGFAIASTGWETMLGGLLRAGFAITGTWPMRSERSARSVAIGTNALASSIVLVCRPRAEDAALATRREFVTALKDGA